MQPRDKNPLVSIIVPAFNEATTIEKCLQSIKHQTYPDDELIVVDDGSTDKTAVLAQQYADVFIKIRHSGPAVARNLAAKRAKGKILVFIDADMYVDTRYIANIIKPIVEGKAKATFTKEEYIANMDNKWARFFADDNNLENTRIPKDFPNFSTRFRAIEKKFFNENGGYNENVGYGEDDVLKKDEAVCAKGAICYHYNPSTLKDVFLSARWMGRSINLKPSFRNLLRYSFINSLRNCLRVNVEAQLISFILYKLVFDFGVFCGMISKNKQKNYAK